MVILNTETLFTAPWRTNRKEDMVVNKRVMSFLVLNFCRAKEIIERVADKAGGTIIFPVNVPVSI